MGFHAVEERLSLGWFGAGLCDEFGQWRSGFFESLEVLFFVIGDSIFSASVDDAEPFEGEGSAGGLCLLSGL